MPHQCVRCGKFHDDGDSTLLQKGCSCGSRLWFFVKKESIDKAKTITTSLTPEQKAQIEEDVLEIIGETNPDEPVVLDLESIRITEPGKFELDLVQLFNKDKPIVFKLAEGKYMIDIPETFQRRRELGEKHK
ncbi:MAG: Zn-ribbon domain-containing protein [Nanoarchaeota archaeon]|nr:Zn-ribbon domain-containing protein [Nanoarchaeota archaeon]